MRRTFNLAKVLSLSRGVINRRWLVPAYHLLSVPIAWECAVCGKFFSLSVEEAGQASSQFPPPYIEREFRLHNCELQMARRFADPEF